MGQISFIHYIQDNPKLFAIAKSEMCLGLLRILKEQGLPLSEIKQKDYYSRFTKDDLETLLDVLVTIKLISKDKVGRRYIFYTNKNTNDFLKIYDATRKGFSI